MPNSTIFLAVFIGIGAAVIAVGLRLLDKIMRDNVNDRSTSLTVLEIILLAAVGIFTAISASSLVYFSIRWGEIITKLVKP